MHYRRAPPSSDGPQLQCTFSAWLPGYKTVVKNSISSQRAFNHPEKKKPEGTPRSEGYRNKCALATHMHTRPPVQDPLQIPVHIRMLKYNWKAKTITKPNATPWGMSCHPGRYESGGRHRVFSRGPLNKTGVWIMHLLPFSGVQAKAIFDKF